MTKVHGRVLTSVLVLFALVVAVVGVQPAGAASSTVTIGATLAPPTLDLTRNAAAGIPEVLLYNVYEGLVKLDKAGKIKPLLAQSWTISKNGRVYTFKLHSGVHFQNGDPLTADDVVFSFERVLHPPPHAPASACRRHGARQDGAGGQPAHRARDAQAAKPRLAVRDDRDLRA